MRRLLDSQRPVGFESRKAYAARCASGFWTRHLTGPHVVDIGYRGGTPGALPIVDGAVGFELDTPGYDGLRLPFEDKTIDAVHASHVLEHIRESDIALQEWFRVLRIGGRLLLFVPHAYLYERRLTVPPSRWSPEHVRSYTPLLLLMELEMVLPLNTWRLRHLADNDVGYDYTLPIDQHPVGCLEIECVIEKITGPTWEIEP